MRAEQNLGALVHALVARLLFLPPGPTSAPTNLLVTNQALTVNVDVAARQR